jgi:hypothetical protein
MLGPPVAEPPLLESFEFDFAGDPRCLGVKDFNHPVRHTVYDSHGRKASVQQNVTVRPVAYRVDEGASTTLSFTSQLLAPPPDGRARGQIVVNAMALPPSDNASAARHELRVTEGTVSIALTLLTAAPPGSYWELDFTSSANVAPGSLRAETGAVAASGERRIVLRLNGDRGETMRLRLTIR